MKKINFKLLTSAIALGLAVASTTGSTFAWFAMNTVVTANGMNVKAKAEAGLVITNSDKSAYDVSATATNSDLAELMPTSTADCTNWVHANSTNPSSATGSLTAEGYTAVSSGDYDKYFAKYTFYIRSSSAVTLNVGSLDVKSVSAKVSGAAAAQEMSKALRVGVSYASATYIYAPVTGATLSYNYKNGAAGETAVTAVGGTNVSKNTAAAAKAIPGNTAAGVEVTVYVWFEGEDPACKSDNIVATFESLTVSVEFTTTAVSA